MLSNERAIVVGVDGSPQARLADGARHRDVVLACSAEERRIRDSRRRRALLMPSTGPGRGCSSMTQSD